jgi:hypothetical protein
MCWLGAALSITACSRRFPFLAALRCPFPSTSWPLPPSCCSALLGSFLRCLRGNLASAALPPAPALATLRPLLPSSFLLGSSSLRDGPSCGPAAGEAYARLSHWPDADSWLCWSAAGDGLVIVPDKTLTCRPPCLPHSSALAPPNAPVQRGRERQQKKLCEPSFTASAATGCWAALLRCNNN